MIPDKPTFKEGERPIDRIIAQAEEQVRQENTVRKFYNDQWGGAFRNLIIFDIVIVFVWSLLDRFMPSGWWITAINIAGFIWSVFFVGIGIWEALKLRIPNGVAFFISIVLWWVIVIGGRTLFLTILGI
jgi:hypothetical protein